MSVGHDLYREVVNYAPADLTAGELVVALIIADDASDKTRLSFIANGELCRRTRMRPSTVRKHLAALAARGLEFRVSHGLGDDGRPVFAARGHATDYAVPDVLKAAMDVAPIGPMVGATSIAALLVDNPANGAMDVAPTGEERRYETGGKALRNTPIGATSIAPPYLNPLNPLTNERPVVTTSVEGPEFSTGQEQVESEPPAGMTALEAAAWRAAHNGRQP